jgi:hypothetical protein
MPSIETKNQILQMLTEAITPTAYGSIAKTNDTISRHLDPTFERDAKRVLTQGNIPAARVLITRAGKYLVDRKYSGYRPPIYVQGWATKAHNAIQAAAPSIKH